MLVPQQSPSAQQQNMYQQQQQQQQQPPVSTIQIAAPMMVLSLGPAVMGPEPQQIACPQCHRTVVTNVTCRPSMVGIILAVILFILCFPTACIPLCVCQDKSHRCPACGAVVGEYRDPTCQK